MRSETLRVKDIAELTGCSRWTIYRRHDSGELPGYRNPRRRTELLFRRDDVDRVFGLGA